MLLVNTFLKKITAILWVVYRCIFVHRRSGVWIMADSFSVQSHTHQEKGVLSLAMCKPQNLQTAFRTLGESLHLHDGRSVYSYMSWCRLKFATLLLCNAFPTRLVRDARQSHKRGIQGFSHTPCQRQRMGPLQRRKTAGPFFHFSFFFFLFLSFFHGWWCHLSREREGGI